MANKIFISSCDESFLKFVVSKFGEGGEYFVTDTVIKEIGETEAEELEKKLIGNNYFADSKKIKILLTDCDGCLTDAGLYYTENGDEIKKFNAHDGMAFNMLRSAGVICGIVTGEIRELNTRRAKKLQLDICYGGIKDKLSAVKEIAKDYNCTLDEICYIGDDINDTEVLQNVGFACCPADACSEVLSVAGYIATKAGGAGVIREIAELILKNKNK
ncbi:MAG: HAD-IIIA family hydrolase [Synergistaceae bacterium]|nr:HAD-IIIA family hydrolase [Synergistaceae bacterium]